MLKSHPVAKMYVGCFVSSSCTICVIGLFIVPLTVCMLQASFVAGDRFACSAGNASDECDQDEFMSNQMKFMNVRFYDAKIQYFLLLSQFLYLYMLVKASFMGKILIKDVTLDGRVTDILILGNRIAGIGAGLSVPQGCRILSGRGKVAVPGFVNMHTHSAMTITRGYKEDAVLQEWLQEIWKVEARMDEEAIYWGTKLACLEMLKTGTTTFYDQYWMPDVAVRAVQEMGLRSWHSFVALDLKDEGKSAAIKEGMEAMYEKSLQWGDRCSMSVGVHAPYTVSDSMIRWCSDFARSKGLTMHIHVSETEQENLDSVALNGCSPFMHLENLGVLGPEVIAAHCVWLSTEDMDIMADSGVTAVYNVNSNLKLASGCRFLYNELRDRGVHVCLGTDGCGSSNNLDMREAMKTAALVQKGWRRDPTAMPLQELMQVATLNGARALGLDAGVIAEGKLADIVLVDTDNYAFVPGFDFLSDFVYSANSSCIDTVICNGEIVMEDRIVPGENIVLEQTKRILKKLYI